MAKTLFLIPNLLGEVEIESSLPAGAISVVRGIKHFFVEEDKSARRLIKACGVPTPFTDITFYRLDKRTTTGELEEYWLESGENDIGVLSEAGCPGIADPGAKAVRMAHTKGWQVKPLAGPSSILLALMASGANGQSFIFHGYLPASPAARIKKVQELDKQAHETGYTQIFIETPYRNNYLLDAIIQVCSPETRLCVAVELTLPTEMIQTKTIARWKKVQTDLKDKPTVFLLWAEKPAAKEKNKRKHWY
ncbi:MAG: SAM-dependent methyltransferase [Bacteroidota bacterium]|nr:SAM-dependent methyltransferase [Bacteroidota bacterium]